MTCGTVVTVPLADCPSGDRLANSATAQHLHSTCTAPALHLLCRGTGALTCSSGQRRLARPPGVQLLNAGGACGAAGALVGPGSGGPALVAAGAAALLVGRQQRATRAAEW